MCVCVCLEGKKLCRPVVVDGSYLVRLGNIKIFGGLGMYGRNRGVNERF